MLNNKYLQIATRRSLTLPTRWNSLGGSRFRTGSTPCRRLPCRWAWWPSRWRSKRRSGRRRSWGSCTFGCRKWYPHMVGTFPMSRSWTRSQSWSAVRTTWKISSWSLFFVAIGELYFHLHWPAILATVLQSNIHLHLRVYVRLRNRLVGISYGFLFPAAYERKWAPIWLLAAHLKQITPKHGSTMCGEHLVLYEYFE